MIGEQGGGSDEGEPQGSKLPPIPSPPSRALPTIKPKKQTKPLRLPGTGGAPPAPGQPGDNSSRTALIVAGAIVLAAALVGGAVLVTGGGSPSGSQAPEARQGPSVRNPGGATGPARRPKSPPPQLPPGLEDCSPTLKVNTVTSCPFARNVERAYYAGGEDRTLTAYSPVTRLDYTMRCSGSNPAVCTGGNEAAVYILPR